MHKFSLRWQWQGFSESPFCVLHHKTTVPSTRHELQKSRLIDECMSHLAGLVGESRPAGPAAASPLMLSFLEVSVSA